MAPKVSVLTAAYNSEQFIETAVNSVLSQQMSDLELVVSDNVSSDATQEIVRSLASTDERVRYFRNSKHTSAVENFNLCYRRSNPDAPYIALLASDDWWRPEFLERVVDVAEADEKISFVYADMYRTNASGAVLNRYSQLSGWNGPAGTHNEVRNLYFNNYINIMAAVTRRNAIDALLPRENLFDTSLILTPDYEFWLQLMSRGATAHFIDEPLAYYRKHEDAMTMPTNSISRLREEITIFEHILNESSLSHLDGVRRKSLAIRYAQLGFQLLESGNVAGSRRALLRSGELNDKPRLDTCVAHVLTSLPVSSRVKSILWQRAIEVRGLLA